MTSSTTTCNIQGIDSWHVCRGVPSSIHWSGLGMWISKCWLVLWTSLKNDGVRQLGWWHSRYMESHKNVPNHQPEYIEPRHINHRRALLVTPTDFACDSSAHHVLRLVQQRNLTETTRQMPRLVMGFRIAGITTYCVITTMTTSIYQLFWCSPSASQAWSNCSQLQRSKTLPSLCTNEESFP